MHRRMVVLLLLCVLAASCVQSTGGAIVDFPVAASGAPDTTAGQPLRFTSDRGWDVVLTKATLHIGAIYLDAATPVSGAQDTPCVLPGTYLGQETSALDVDLLSPSPQRFPTPAHGTTGDAVVAQLWLTGTNEIAGGDIDAIEDPTPVLQVSGTATLGTEIRPFSGSVTIGTNRQASSSLASASPICKQRIVSVLGAVQVQRTGGLLVRIDARKLFTNVDFGALAKAPDGYAFADAPGADQPSTNLYSNLHAGSASGSPYAFKWAEDL
jgi:hypothetical protein